MPNRLPAFPQAGAATSAVVADVERQQVRRRSAQTDCFLVARTCRWWSIQPPAAAADANAQGGGAGRGTGGGRGQMTPEQQAAMQQAQQKQKDWRAAATPATWKAVRKQFDDAGINLRILCYNMGAKITDDINYAFRMARDLGVQAISSTSTVPVTKRVAPFANNYKIMWGGHGHDEVQDPNQFAKPETFAEIISFSPYIGVNLDIGHFTAAGYDAGSYIK